MFFLNANNPVFFETKSYSYWTDGSFCSLFLSNSLYTDGKITIDYRPKIEIMLDIIDAFWEIWLDIVLNTSFFEAFRASFRVKITLDYRPKKSK